MADQIQIKLQNEAAIRAALGAVADALTAPELRKVYLAAGRLIRDQARRNAPRRTGLLRRSIDTFASKTRDKERQAAITWVRLFKGSVRAPHAHLVEFGTARPRSSRGKFMRFKDQFGGWVSRKVVARMPGSFFFRRAIDSHGIPALQFALNNTDRIILERWTQVKSTFSL